MTFFEGNNYFYRAVPVIPTCCIGVMPLALALFGGGE
jgi:hypothetical protein